MALKLEDLDVARAFMIEEIDMDARNDQIYLSTYLTQSGQGQWADMLRAAAQNGNDDSLAAEITRAGVLNRRIQKRSPKGRIIWADVPYNANQVLGEGEFNRYFCRGLSRHAIEAQIPRLEVYRAKQVTQPRMESERKIGMLVEPAVILIDLRSSQGVEPALGIPPGPGSGITLRIPKN